MFKGDGLFRGSASISRVMCTHAVYFVVVVEVHVKERARVRVFGGQGVGVTFDKRVFVPTHPCQGEGRWEGRWEDWSSVRGGLFFCLIAFGRLSRSTVGLSEAIRRCNGRDSLLVLCAFKCVGVRISKRLTPMILVVGLV